MLRLLLPLLFFTKVGIAADTFKLHLSIEPSTLSPFVQKNSSAGYLLQQISAPLLKIRSGKLLSNMADCKQLKPTQAICTLKKNLKWSDGSSLTAEDYVNSFVQFLLPETKSGKPDLLFPIKNAESIFLGQKTIKDLGIKAENKTGKIIFDLESPDTEFLYQLASPLLTPYRSEKITPGAYFVQEWNPKKKIILAPNPYASWAHPKRPQLEFIVITEDTVALQLFEKGELSYLRRLPTLYIPKYRDKKEFHFVDQFRFDYLGFSQEMSAYKEVRQILATAINFDDMMQVYWGKPRPGCIGIPHSVTQGPLCLNHNKALNQKNWMGVKKLKNLELTFSKQGGDDHQRAMEWVQSEWKKNLGANISVKGYENKIFVNLLETATPTIFRKGLNPERPTCLAILENFLPNARENYIQLNSDKLNSLTSKLIAAKTPKEKTKLCRQALSYLLDEHLLIPLGPISFSILVDTKWADWHLNELNQLDLSQLHLKMR